MTGAEIKTFVDALTNDSAGDTWYYNALNAAKDKIEGLREWEFLKKLNSSNTHASGATSATTYALPADFESPIQLTVGSDTTARSLISYGDQRMLRDEPGYFFINWNGSTFSLTGTEGAGGTIYLLYKMFSPDVASGTEPIWPERFQRLLGYEVAKQWFAMDAGEREFSWSPEMAAESNALLQAMILWDEKLKAKAVNSTPADMTFAAQIS